MAVCIPNFYSLFPKQREEGIGRDTIVPILTIEKPKTYQTNVDKGCYQFETYFFACLVLHFMKHDFEENLI